MSPLRPPSYCSSPGCQAFALAGGRCAVHARQREQSRPNVAFRRQYSTMRWRRLRQQVLVDQAYQCHRCPTVTTELEVHHRLKADDHPDRFWDRDVLEGLCHACHVAATMRGE